MREESHLFATILLAIFCLPWVLQCAGTDHGVQERPSSRGLKCKSKLKFDVSNRRVRNRLESDLLFCHHNRFVTLHAKFVTKPVVTQSKTQSAK